MLFRFRACSCIWTYFFVVLMRKFLAGCDQICVEPLTSTPFGSPCGCVFPMKVRLLLDIAPFAVFPVMNELEIEVAAGTYLEQSQVKIMGASADSQNQGRTLVDINLVPLGEKFDNTTAVLIYERFWHKKVPLNVTLFGSYEAIYISYPGSNLYSLGKLPFQCFVTYKLVMIESFLIRNSIFTSIWELHWYRSKWEYWRSPSHSKFCQQELENEHKNHCYYCFVCHCACIDFDWSCLCPHKVEEIWKTVKCCWSCICIFYKQKIW